MDESTPAKKLDKTQSKAPVNPYKPPIPFPQRLEKQKLEQQCKKFFEVFKKLHINIPLADVLFQMPSYSKFLKDILSNKHKLGDHETVMLTEECSVGIQKNLPQKLKDPGSFTVPCTIGEVHFDKVLKLGLGEAKATTVMLQLADRSLTHPRGIIEDVLVQVEKFIFPTDFLILDMEEDKDIPLILGRPFLATGRALFNVQNGQLILRLEEE
ncbi:uncharacterized protein LOC111400705 [Olea europaea var. sylvestris]|uniref:uncharacterized protein LOC111400705 n=1 Tax=Olea europaea var. sylvestris TaxID=158386 RepID=UPI000C1D83D5|nr:uncharacterized protein LOC111400705 [Olea europaea var. sylvestris]